MIWTLLAALAAEPARISVVAVGDIMMHSAVKRAARDAGGPNAGFDALWTDVAPVLTAADLAFGNLETPTGPTVHVPIRGEVFWAPPELAPSLATAGWDVLALANNHGYDQGIAGVQATYDAVAAAGMHPVGGGPTRAVAHAPVLVERDGVKLAFLARSDLMNLDPRPPADQPTVATAGPRCAADCGPDRDAIPYTVDVDEIAGQVRAARDAGADLVILSMHWGIEYQTTPLPYQAPLAERLTDAGVDVILGHHPHVLQPVVTRTTADGRTALIAYSLGNFVSDMAARWDPATSSVARGNMRDGVILSFDVVKDAAGTRLDAVRAIPTWTVNDALTRGDGPTVIRPVVIARALRDADAATARLLDLRRQNIIRVVGPEWFDASAP